MFECKCFITKAKYLGPKSVPDLKFIISLYLGSHRAMALQKPESDGLPASFVSIFSSAKLPMSHVHMAPRVCNRLKDSSPPISHITLTPNLENHESVVQESYENYVKHLKVLLSQKLRYGSQLTKMYQ